MIFISLNSCTITRRVVLLVQCCNVVIRALELGVSPVNVGLLSILPCATAAAGKERNNEENGGGSSDDYEDFVVLDELFDGVLIRWVSVWIHWEARAITSSSSVGVGLIWNVITWLNVRDVERHVFSDKFWPKVVFFIAGGAVVNWSEFWSRFLLGDTHLDKGVTSGVFWCHIINDVVISHEDVTKIPCVNLLGL